MPKQTPTKTFASFSIDGRGKGHKIDHSDDVELAQVGHCYTVKSERDEARDRWELNFTLDREQQALGFTWKSKARHPVAYSVKKDEARDRWEILVSIEPPQDEASFEDLPEPSRLPSPPANDRASISEGPEELPCEAAKAG